MSFHGTYSGSNIIPSKNQSSSNNNKNLNNLEDIKENINNGEIDENENEEYEDNGEIDEIDEEEEQENKDEDNNNNNKDESQKLNNQGEVGKSKLERAFIYLRSGFSWRPIPTIMPTVLCLEITGAVFIVIGIIIFIFSKKIKQIEIRYDNNENCQIGSICNIDFKLPWKMKKNVFVYYRLKNFYQNHRRYIKSKSMKQLKGNVVQENEIKDDCDPIILNKDIYEGVRSYDNSTELDPEDVAFPCGLIAKSYFNDTYKIKKQGGNETIIISKNGIAWSVDRDKYKNSENANERQWLDVEDERFIVWMRPAAIPDFRKPWGIVERDLTKGDYVVTITNNYPVKSFEGQKYFILSTVNGLGGKNYFLAILYFIMGGISIVSGLLFYIGYKKYNSEKFQKVD